MARSVFYDIADSEEEATNLAARSLLMIAIEERIGENGWTQAKAAEVLGVSQPRVSDLMTGKIDKFSLDALVNMLPAVGLSFRVDRTADVGQAATPGPFAAKRPKPPAPSAGVRKTAAKKGSLRAVAKAKEAKKASARTRQRG